MWIHLGSIGLSQGLLIGRKQRRMRAPAFAGFTSRLLMRIQARAA
jgi:hypothetical protein